MRIWLNRTYATYYHLARKLAETDGITVVGTHINGSSPFLQACHESLPELSAPTVDDYIDEALIFCQTHGIDVFWPTLHQESIEAARERFEAEGVVLVGPGLKAVQAFGSKSEGYATANKLGLEVPPHRVVSSRDEFVAAWTELRATERTLCIKPNTGVGADGFKVITEAPLSLTAFSSHEAHLVRLPHLLEAMGATDCFHPQILMAHLPGREYSIDCLSTNGEAIGMYPRRKPRDSRFTELLSTSDLLPQVEALLAVSNMSGLCNVQFMEDGEGQPLLLEVNTRAAGGLHHWYSTVGNLPLAALRLALGEDLPPLFRPQKAQVLSVESSLLVEA